MISFSLVTKRQSVIKTVGMYAELTGSYIPKGY